MIECYFRWCRWHHQDEPICTKNRCIATSNEIEIYRQYRKDELTRENANDTGEDNNLYLD